MEKEYVGPLAILSVVILGICLVVLSVGFTYHNMYRDGYSKLDNYVARGIDPIEAGCAVWADNTSIACVIQAARNGGDKH